MLSVQFFSGDKRKHHVTKMHLISAILTFNVNVFICDNLQTNQNEIFVEIVTFKICINVILLCKKNHAFKRYLLKNSTNFESNPIYREASSREIKTYTIFEFLFKHIIQFTLKNRIVNNMNKL